MSKPPTSPLVALGRFGKAHGLRGEIRLKVYNPESDLLWAHSQWVLSDTAGRRTVVAEKVRDVAPDVAIVALQGVGSRAEADAFKGLEVSLDRSQLPSLSEDEWYVRDLVGLRVLDKQKQPLGEVLDTVCYPSVDCLQIRTERGLFELPMVAPYLDEVDVAAGHIIVGSFDGLDPVVEKKRGPK